MHTELLLIPTCRCFVVEFCLYLIIYGIFKSNPFFIFVKNHTGFHRRINMYINMSEKRDFFAVVVVPCSPESEIDKRFLHVQGILIDSFIFRFALYCSIFVRGLVPALVLLPLLCVIQS